MKAITDNPKISVVMSVYNGEKYLREAVESILKQTYQDFEFIIVNDGSTDKTLDMLNEYAKKDKRIRTIQNEKNIGLTKSLNKALKLSKGEYIARMDADDVSRPERLEKQVLFFDKNPSFGLIGTGYTQIDTKGNEIKKINIPIGRNEILRHLLLFGSPFCHSSIMFKKYFAEKIGFYDESMKYAQDYYFSIKMFDVCNIDNYPEMLQKWRYNPQQGISVKQKVLQEQASNKIRNELIAELIEKNLLDDNDLIQLVKTNPNDKIVISHCLKTYEKSKHVISRDRLVYLQAKYLYSPCKWKWLNKIGLIYLGQDKKHLAYMYFVESLRLNPDQPHVLKMAESLKKYSFPKYPASPIKSDVTVSVIMPTYNRTEELRTSIQSVLNQTFQNFELIVINDGGPHNICNIVKSFGASKIKYYRLRRNRGRPVALNEAIVRSRGKYIAYLDDDDIYYPRHLEVLVSFLEKHKNYDFVYSDSWRSYGKVVDGHYVEGYKTRYSVRPATFDRSLLLKRNYISTLNILHRRSCFENAGMFNEDLSILDDWDLWLRIVNNSKFKQINQITGEYRWKHDNTAVIDRLAFRVQEAVMRPYYAFNCGNIAMLKCYIKTGQNVQANRILDRIKETYDFRRKSYVFVREIFLLQGFLLATQNDEFRKKVIKDYFIHDPKDCLRFLMRNNTLLSTLPHIIQAVTTKVSSGLRGRFLGFINFANK